MMELKPKDIYMIEHKLIRKCIMAAWNSRERAADIGVWAEGVSAMAEAVAEALEDEEE
jgi:hypothetical protein